MLCYIISGIYHVISYYVYIRYRLYHIIYTWCIDITILIPNIHTCSPSSQSHGCLQSEQTRLLPPCTCITLPPQLLTLFGGLSKGAPSVCPSAAGGCGLSESDRPPGCCCWCWGHRLASCCCVCWTPAPTPLSLRCLECDAIYIYYIYIYAGMYYIPRLRCQLVHPPPGSDLWGLLSE